MGRARRHPADSASIAPSPAQDRSAQHPSQQISPTSSASRSPLRPVSGHPASSAAEEPHVLISSDISAASYQQQDPVLGAKLGRASPQLPTSDSIELDPYPLESQHHAPPDPDPFKVIATEFDLDPEHPTATDMASKKTPFLAYTAVSGARSDLAPYGSVSLTPSRNNSPTGSDAALDNAHQLRHVSEHNRSGSSKLSSLSKQSSRFSEDLDTAVLVSGLDGRFGIAEATQSGGILDSEGKDDDSSDEGSLLGDDAVPLSDHDSHDNSPHEAVRASVPATDNTTLSINTPRMWFLSVLFAILGSSTNLFFSLRYPSVAITPVIALLLVHPLGLLWDYALKRPYDPEEEFVDGVLAPQSSRGRRSSGSSRREIKRIRSWRLWLAQGSWNEKEHTCVYVSSNVAFGFAFATDVIVEQTQFYNQEAPILYQLLLTISTQILGYGFAGLTRHFLVHPSGMIWPGTLMSAAMFSTLHKQDNKPANGWTISRWKFFYIIWIGSFLFYFLPGLLMPALSYFNVVTWFAPKNVVVANLFGVVSGLGFFPLTFDWAQVTYVGSPLLVPFWASVNVVGGLVIIMWVVAPLLYYSNFLYTSYMPVLSAAVFDNTGNVYDVSKILTSEFVFDRAAYRNYSRVFLPVTYMLSYGMQFAGLAALLMHTFVWHGSDMMKSLRRAVAEIRSPEAHGYQPVAEPSDGRPGNNSRRPSTARSSGSSGLNELLSHEDIHGRLMKRYKDAPLSWYLVTFATMTAIGIFVVEYYPIHLPWYGLLLALGLGAIFFIPNGIIMAVTNQHSSIYLVCQLICGVVFPGRPVANMVFVAYGYISSAQGIKFASDLKLGHYMKIPPRIMFTVQIVATLVSSVVQIVVLNWMFANVSGICTSAAVNGFTCPIARVHFNGSILWGVVGPGEFFGPKAMYRWLVWCFPLGAILPIPLWLYSRNKKHSLLRKVNVPVICGAMSWIPPATGLNFSVWALVCYVFNYHVKHRANAWWSKYTMTLSAALDSGLAFGIVVVFFGFVYPGWMNNFSWWGTEVYKQGCDWQACPYMTVDQGERFGPSTW
ncbi:hypothetical protein S40285_02836 [Stachybotrys chlorohalonatus IBT 40285]|uniref:OPT family small oligopeptide transporter n=1 Tax=Stachybotrys chlorohalonatus (strain IBT 40285) TaxID=1283841 RepID=A0A084QD78_STAC4|nr:hypothetical protein S40285_02836 [Stachybotrys chlorohalonata IBT 40285]